MTPEKGSDAIHNVIHNILSMSVFSPLLSNCVCIDAGLLNLPTPITNLVLHRVNITLCLYYTDFYLHDIVLKL